MNALNNEQTNFKQLFQNSHQQDWPLMIDDGKSSTLFERATADTLWDAYIKSKQSLNQFIAVSAATGAGKTLGAQALMHHLFPLKTALVIKEIKEAHEAYIRLCKLIGEDNVAIHTSVHRENANLSGIETFTNETGHRVTRSFSETQFKNAPVVICTHQRWKSEYESGNDRGVRLCEGQPRELIIIDEEPGLERVYVAQPEDVSKLSSVLTDTMLHGEARSYGFCAGHLATTVLTDVSHRMGIAKDSANSPNLLCQQDLIKADEVEAILSLTREDILKRLMHLPEMERMFKTDQLDKVREFLIAACEGRVFYAKQSTGGQFFAYSYAVPAQQNTIILDGTADFNGLYSVGSSVMSIDAPNANYENVELNYIPLTKEFSGRNYWESKNIRKVRQSRKFMEWFREQLLKNTSAGEEILVYCPQVLTDTDLHNQMGDQCTLESANYCEWEERKIHWCHFGSGRGTNRFKDCTVFFQIRAFFKPKAVTVATTASHAPDYLNGERLRNLSSGKTKDPVYFQVSNTLVACDTKQNATRIGIRKLDDLGKAQAGRLYFVGDDLSMITDYQSEMFPSAGLVKVHTDDLRLDLKNSSGTERLEHLLLTSEEYLLSFKSITSTCTIHKQHILGGLRSKQVKAAMTARNWSLTTLKKVGLSGKGSVLVRK